MSRLIDSVRAEVDAANEVVKSLDKNMMKTARIVKIELQSSYDLYNSKVSDYLELKVEYQDSDDDNEDSSAVLIEQHAAILKEVKTVSRELEAIAASVPSVSVGRSKSAEDTIVKLEKLKCPKFSGTPRDYSQF